jgi:hypothetical protein|tara:strand:+ start:260 stop:481 length:222 start_codon:yes stop_codon:yes gene_type:complete
MMLVFEFMDGPQDGLVADMQELPLGAILQVPADMSEVSVSVSGSREMGEPRGGGSTFEYLHTKLGEMTFIGYG